MKKIIILLISVFMIFTVVGCSKKQESVEEPKNEADETTSENQTTAIGNYYDPQPHILEDLVVKDVDTPTLYITGNRWIYDDETLQELWKMYYPYMQVVFGPIADDFWEQGLTWNMTDETLSTHYNEQVPKDNRIDMGDQRANEEYRICAYSLVHETGHIWLQNLNTGLQFDCGQWLWEGNTCLFELIANLERLDVDNRSETFLANTYDLDNYPGGDVINGCWTDGDRAGYGRSIADSQASNALFYLNTALSTPGTYDYWQKVSIERTKYAKENNLEATNPEALIQIMDKVAEGKTFDGMGPGEWLFSRSVANTNGADGVHIGVFGFSHSSYKDPEPFTDDRGNYVTPHYSFSGANVYGVYRENRKETALEGTDVEVSIYDCFGKEIGRTTATIEDNGLASFDTFYVPNSNQRVDDMDFPEFSATRYVAKALVNGKEYIDVNFGLNTFHDDNILKTDNRMFFILINEDETINTSLKDIEVSGAYNVDKTHLNHGLLIVQANQGDNVIVNGKEYTKPAGARMIPFIVR